jgi:hypothetical protein
MLYCFISYIPLLCIPGSEDGINWLPDKKETKPSDVAADKIKSP